MNKKIELENIEIDKYNARIDIENSKYDQMIDVLENIVKDLKALRKE